jgi:hypothetical protein
VRRFVVSGVVLLALYAAMFAWGAAAASAAPVPTYTHACSDPAVWDPDSCERLTYIASELSAIDDSTAASAAAAPDAVTQANLTWWGVWAACGLLLTLLVAPLFVNSWRFLRS